MHNSNLSIKNRTITNNSSNDSSNEQKDTTKKSGLSPNWLTGFTDAEGCFSVIFSQISTLKWRIIVSFEINLHSKDIEILNQIKDVF